MINDDCATGQQDERQEGLRETARKALGRTRGFSPRQEASFVGDGRTLRANLLDKWQRLLGMPQVQEETTPKGLVRPTPTQPGPAYQGPASMVTDIQGHEIGSGIANGDKTSSLDRVREMNIVRGSVSGSRRQLTVRLRETVLEIQKAAFVRQSLPQEEEEAWSRTPPLKRWWKRLQAFVQEPSETSLRDLGRRDLGRDPSRVWKDFVACFSPETLRYQCEIRERFDLEDPQALTDLLFAASRAMFEFAQPTREAGQPVGYIVTSATKATEIRPYRAGDEVPILLYHKAGRRSKGVLIIVRPGEQKSILYAQIRRAMETRDHWQDLGVLDAALIAVNVTCPKGPGEGMFSQGAVRPGFRAGQRAHPWLVFYQGQDTQGNLHLQASADHFACDGRLLALFIRGGEAGGQLFKGLAGFYAEETGQVFLVRTPSTLTDLTISDYGQVVLAKMPRPNVESGGDLFTCAVLWAIGLHINHMQEVRGGIWKRLNANASCNFTVTERGNALKPLSVASCWLASPESYSLASPFYHYRHVLSLTTGLIGFKLGKDHAFGQGRVPEAVSWMSLLVHNRFPDWFKKRTLELNRSSAFTDIRNHLFPPTIIFEQETGELVHNTVAGTDLPNVVIWDDHQDDEVTLTFSIAPGSHFVAPGELFLLAGWIAAAMRAFLELVGQWQRDEAGTLRGLNQKIELLYQEQRKELANLYPNGGKGRRRTANY
ncbi:MAG: hypothetical protein JXA89_15715 [Anaerolineae bacterium]|nr:hypothetical protein [Anaerolineae bacterium]